MNILEIDETINDIQIALGYVVQNVYFYDKTLVLSLWQNHKVFWLVICLDYSHQSLFLIPEQKSKLKMQKKPIQTFALAHLKQLYFTDITRIENYGRKIQLLFSASEKEDVVVEVVLVPTSLNLSIHKGKKSVYLFKPKELDEFKAQQNLNLKTKSIESYKQSWLENLKSDLKSILNEKQKSISTLDAEIQKKIKAIQKIETDIDKKRNDDIYQFAILIQKNADEAKIKFPDLFEPKKSIYKLKDEAFEKLKALNQKIFRSEQRLKILQEDLLNLKSISAEEWVLIQQNKGKSQIPSFRQDSSLKVRKLEVESDLVAYFGKSASDNMKLLRSAKPWHLWFHIKESPSAHLILFRSKTRELKDEEIQKTLVWFIRQTSNEKDLSSGGVFEVLMTECRYVRPIKGEKIGRVQYSHEKVIRVAL